MMNLSWREKAMSDCIPREERESESVPCKSVEQPPWSDDLLQWLKDWPSIQTAPLLWRSPQVLRENQPWKTQPASMLSSVINSFLTMNSSSLQPILLAKETTWREDSRLRESTVSPLVAILLSEKDCLENGHWNISISPSPPTHQVKETAWRVDIKER